MMADVSAIDGFSPATRAWFGGAFAAPTAAQEGAWAAAQAGPARAGRGARPAPARPWPRSSGRWTGWPPARRRRSRSTAAGCSTCPRSRRWPSTCSATCAPRWPASGRPPPARAAGPGHHGRHPHRRHPGRRAPALRPHPAGRAGHHPGVAVPDPHLGGPGVAARGAHGDRRRGARRGRHQARRAPGAVPGAARRAAGAARRSGSGSPPPSGRWTRCPRSWPAPARSRWCSRRSRRRSRSASRCRCRIWPRWTSDRPRAAPTRR